MGVNVSLRTSVKKGEKFPGKYALKKSEHSNQYTSLNKGEIFHLQKKVKKKCKFKEINIGKLGRKIKSQKN